MAEQDIVERLRRYARNHEGGFPERLLYTVDHQKVDNEAADRLEAVEAENATLRQQLAEARETARREALEEAAKVADDEAEGRRWQKSDAGAHNDRRAARDFETMMIEAVQIASLIRALSHPDREGDRPSGTETAARIVDTQAQYYAGHNEDIAKAMREAAGAIRAQSQPRPRREGERE